MNIDSRCKADHRLNLDLKEGRRAVTALRDPDSLLMHPRIRVHHGQPSNTNHSIMLPTPFEFSKSFPILTKALFDAECGTPL
jgi:hypothetical protein